MERKNDIILDERSNNNTYYVVGIIITVITIAIVVGITSTIKYSLLIFTGIISLFFHKRRIISKMMKSEFRLGIVMKVDNEHQIVYIYECNKRDALNQEYTIQYQTSVEKIKAIKKGMKVQLYSNDKVGIIPVVKINESYQKLDNDIENTYLYPRCAELEGEWRNLNVEEKKVIFGKEEYWEDNVLAKNMVLISYKMSLRGRVKSDNVYDYLTYECRRDDGRMENKEFQSQYPLSSEFCQIGKMYKVIQYPDRYVICVLDNKGKLKLPLVNMRVQMLLRL